MLALPQRFYMITAAIVFGYLGTLGWKQPSLTGGHVSQHLQRLLKVAARRRWSTWPVFRWILLEFSAARRWWWLAPALVVVGVFVGLALLQQGAAVRTTPFVYTLF